MPLPRFGVRSLMIVVAIAGLVIWASLQFPPCAAVTGPLIGAWSRRWRVGPPYPDAIVGAAAGGVVQSALSAVIVVVFMISLGDRLERELVLGLVGGVVALFVSVFAVGFTALVTAYVSVCLDP